MVLGLVDVHFDESDDKALATAAETARRIPADYPWGKFELAVKLLHIEGGRALAREMLEAAAGSLPHDYSRYGLAHLLLGVLLEKEDSSEARLHLERARSSWTANVPFDEMLKDARDNL
jgi:hypothetical protein